MKYLSIGSKRLFSSFIINFNFKNGIFVLLNLNMFINSDSVLLYISFEVNNFKLRLYDYPQFVPFALLSYI